MGWRTAAAAAGMAAVVGKLACKVVVLVVIQRVDTATAPTATTEKKRKVALVLDSAATSLLDRCPSTAPAGATAIAMAAGLFANRR